MEQDSGRLYSPRDRQQDEVGKYEYVEQTRTEVSDEYKRKLTRLSR